MCHRIIIQIFQLSKKRHPQLKIQQTLSTFTKLEEGYSLCKNSLIDQASLHKAAPQFY